MKFLLDSNVCIRYIAGRSIAVRDKISATSSQDIVMCSVVKAELYWGAARSNRPTETIATMRQFVDAFISFPFDDDAARRFGELRADLFRRGLPIGPYDMQIAAIALANQLTLVTHNTREFSRIQNLALVDWEK